MFLSKMFLSLIGDLHELEWLALYNYFQVGSVSVFIHKNNNLSRSFKTRVGVKQGGPFSPTGFNKQINPMIMWLIRSGQLLKIREVNGGVILYADDTTAITDSAEKMHQVIKIMVEFCARYDIIINEKKTKWMKMGENG